MTKSRFKTLGLAVLTLLLLISTTVLAAPYGSRTLYRGTFGGDVVELQRRLSSLGYETGPADGAYGVRTREAVVRFQQDYGLVPDGLAGKWTFRAVDRAFTWKQGFFYTVIPGDSLWQIGQKTGTTVQALRWLNQLQDDMLYPGQNLRIGPDGKQPAPTPPAPTPPAPTPPAPTPPAPVTPVPAPDPAPPAADPTPTPPAPQPQPPTDPAPPVTTPPSGGTQPPPTDPAPTPPPPAPGLPTNPGGVGTPVDPEPSVPGTTPAPRYEVIGFYAEDWQGDMRSLNSLKAAAPVTKVINFSLLIDKAGTVTTREYPALTAEAKARGLKVEGLVHNFYTNGFDADVARAVLSDTAIRAKLVQNLLKVANQYGLHGINIDIENVPPAQRAGYTALIKELSEVLKPAGKSITISIPAKTWDDTKSSWSGAFDYKALGQYADQVVPMAYDENLPGYYAGPVASLGWVEAVAKFAASQMDPRKVMLGIAGYGYDWKKGTTEGRGISVAQATSLAAKHGAAIQWDAKAQVPWFTYTANGVERIVYFENAYSLEPKLDLVKKYNLGGVAMWRLGLEDPAMWSVIENKLR